MDRRATWSELSTPRFDDLILYQLHVGSFAGHGDGIAVAALAGSDGWVATCKQIVDKLDYIRGLGFNGLALLPIGEVPHQANRAAQRHGACPLPQSVETWFGTIRALISCVAFIRATSFSCSHRVAVRARAGARSRALRPRARRRRGPLRCSPSQCQ